MLTDLQKKTAEAIVNTFETGKPRGNYAAVTLLAGDPGHLTYGRSQTTLASGFLYVLVQHYVDTPGAQYADDFRPYLDRLMDKDLSLDHDQNLRTFLKLAGADPVMQREQDEFFDKSFWQPAAAAAASIGIQSALGTAVVYDSRVHGSWVRIRDRTNSAVGTPVKAGEQKWVKAYVDTRRSWLANHSNPLLRKTVYRMDSFLALIAANNWVLALPITVRGQKIDPAVLGVRPDAVDEPEAPAAADGPVRASAEDAAEIKMRLLKVRSPLLQGDDVKQVQRALVAQGLLKAGDVDGKYGNDTAAAVRTFQDRKSVV